MKVDVKEAHTTGFASSFPSLTGIPEVVLYFPSQPDLFLGMESSSKYGCRLVGRESALVPYVPQKTLPLRQWQFPGTAD